jgi:hypothetical protein
VQRLDTSVLVYHYSAFAFLSSLGVFVFAALRTTPRISAALLPLGMPVGTGIAATLGQVFLTRAFATGVPRKTTVVGLSH